MGDAGTGQTGGVPAVAEGRVVAVLTATKEQLARLEQGRVSLHQMNADRQALLARARMLVGTVRVRRDDVLTDMTLPSMRFDATRRDRDVWRLHIAYAHRRDPVALEKLVAAYLPRAEHHARAHTRRLDDLDDRIQVARE